MQYTWNWYNFVNQLYFSLKISKIKVRQCDHVSSSSFIHLQSCRWGLGRAGFNQDCDFGTWVQDLESQREARKSSWSLAMKLKQKEEKWAHRSAKDIKRKVRWMTGRYRGAGRTWGQDTGLEREGMVLTAWDAWDWEHRETTAAVTGCWRNEWPSQGLITLWQQISTIWMRP